VHGDYIDVGEAVLACVLDDERVVLMVELPSRDKPGGAGEQQLSIRRSATMLDATAAPPRSPTSMPMLESPG
jgi:hypothetical protein